MNKQLRQILKKEKERQQNTIGLIPSENYSSKAVREAVGSILMHKYSEGYPGARYYEGNENIDELEDLCRNLVLKVMLKNLPDEVQADWHANVQVLSGSVANLAVYNSVLEAGDKILSMYLPDGGHLSHGWNYQSKKDKELKDNTNDLVHYGGSKKVTFVSKIFDVIQYKTNPETNLFDYDAIEEIAIQEKPKMIITGGTAYPREIDYKRMKEIAEKVGAYYHADVAHEAGLIASGAMQSPFEYADFVTFTTHKTLRGPKGAVAMCRKKFAKKLDRSVIPGLLGGPFNHSIAGLIQALTEADTKEFVEYSHQVVKNAQIFAEELVKKDFQVVSGGTDKHLILVDLRNKEISGKILAKSLAEVGIISNMNTVPYDTAGPANPSGIRFGTPIITTRGMGETEVKEIVEIISSVANSIKENKFEMTSDKLRETKARVQKLCDDFPLPE